MGQIKIMANRRGQAAIDHWNWSLVAVRQRDRARAQDTCLSGGRRWPGHHWAPAPLPSSHIFHPPARAETRANGLNPASLAPAGQLACRLVVGQTDTRMFVPTQTRAYSLAGAPQPPAKSIVIDNRAGSSSISILVSIKVSRWRQIGEPSRRHFSADGQCPAGGQRNGGAGPCV